MVLILYIGLCFFNDFLNITINKLIYQEINTLIYYNI